MQRRTLLKVGIVGCAALALAGGGAALLHSPAWRNDRLAPGSRAVLGAVARAVLDGSLPADDRSQAVAISAHLDRMEATLRAMSPASQREICHLLAILAMPPGRVALTGLTADWEAVSLAQIQAAMQAMRSSGWSLRQQTYHALRDLTHAAYFADSATWAQLGYPGPVRFD